MSTNYDLEWKKNPRMVYVAWDVLIVDDFKMI